MITIIEGTDGVGKTEFAERLARFRGCELKHAGPPTNNTWWNEYTSSLYRGQNIVLDRWHVGEMVWPALFGRPSLFGKPGRVANRNFATCNRAISLLNAELIIIVRNRSGIIKTLMERGEASQIPLVLAGQRRYMDLALRIKHLQTTVVHSDSLRGRWTEWSSIA